MDDGGNPVKGMKVNVLNKQCLSAVKKSPKYALTTALNDQTAKMTPTRPFTDIL